VSTSRTEERERWTSDVAFYFAAVGAAVGFGNVWRFPSLAADYGGGAFFIPYLLALFLIGIPLLILEVSLGQHFQTGDVGVFGSFHPRFRAVGIVSVSLAYVVVTYYTVLIAWVLHAFFDSWSADAPWDEEGMTGGKAVGYFMSNIIGSETVGEGGLPTRIVWANVGYSFIVWFSIWACLAGGARWTGRIAYFTMGFPIVMLFVFLIKAVTLDGAEDGIKEYIGIWDMSVLSERPDCWSTAVGQIFFSIGVTFGIMTAFGSYNERKGPAVTRSVVIALANSLFSFISGFAVFSSMGHLAKLEGITVNEVPYKGFSLVFGTWPVVFGSFVGGVHWVRLLFLFLFLLGIDSGFGLLEGSLTALADTAFLAGYKKYQISACMALCGWLLSIIYCTDAGLNFLDVVDFYVNFIMLFVGFLETFAAGWMYGFAGQVKKFGSSAVYAYLFANFGSVIIASIPWFFVEFKSVWGGLLALVLSYTVFIIITIHCLKIHMDKSGEVWSLSDTFYDLAFGNIMALREELKISVGFLPKIWAYMMKQFIPHIILILFFNLAVAKREDGSPQFSGYGEYTQWPYQIMGYGVTFFAIFIFALGLIVPDIYKSFDKILPEDAKTEGGVEMTA